MIVWTFRDARSRSRDVFAVLLASLMVVLFGPLGLLLYFLLRPQVTLAELYERSLEEEALLQDLEEQQRCPGCSRAVENAWMVCPDCHTQLKKRCHSCEELLHLKWNVCPFCGTNQASHTIDFRTAAPAQAQRSQQSQPMSSAGPSKSSPPVQELGAPAISPAPKRPPQAQPLKAPHAMPTRPIPMPPPSEMPDPSASSSASSSEEPDKQTESA
jgi:RNA polymerase subunit RPABC4/transcription elongation factor Spt4